MPGDDPKKIVQPDPAVARMRGHRTIYIPIEMEVGEKINMKALRELTGEDVSHIR